MSPFNHLVDLLVFVPIAFICLILSIKLAHAQTVQPPFSPISTGGAASVFIEGKGFYIQAGFTPQGMTPQAFSISLSTSWNTTSPPFTKLPDGLNDYRFPNTLLSDGVSWFAVNNKAWLTYNLDTGSRVQHGPLNTYSGVLGLNAVLDRRSGEVVIPNGNADSMQTTTLYVTPWNLSTRSDSQTGGVASGLARYSLVWSESAQKVLLFGGVTTSGGYSASLLQRDSATGEFWTPITAGGGPSPRESACMVSAFNGTKIILFGGSGPLDVPYSDVFIFDVAAGAWSQGAAAGSGGARSAHVCAVSGDALIVWGGFANIATRIPPPDKLAVYNLTSNKWVGTYNPPISKQVPTSISTPASLKPTSTAGTGPGPGSSPRPGSGSENGDGVEPTSHTSGSGSNTGAIVGGSVAAVVTLVVILFFLWRWDRRKKGGTISNVHDQQNNEGSPYYKESTEKSRNPHAGLNVQSGPEPVNGARHPQMDKLKQQYGYVSETQPLYGLNNPQLEMPQHQYQFGAEMQSTYGERHPQSEIPQESAETQPAYGVHRSQFEVPRHRQGHQQRINEGYYDFKDPVARYNNPHGDLNEQPVPRIPPRPAKGIRHPQLDITQRERELVAEMEMLRMDRGNAPTLAQHTDRWSVDRSGGGSYHA